LLGTFIAKVKRNLVYMKNVFRLSGVILLILSIFLIHSCKKKEEVPVITTTAVSNITATTATSGGNITSEGSSTVISRGVCWSTGTTPTIADSKTADGAGAGSFPSNITSLNGGTIYYVRAYATNEVGTGYGMAMSFTTLGQIPTATSQAATNITTTSATLNGTVNANFLSTNVTFEYGTTTSYGSTSTATQSPVTGNTITNVSADIIGLTAGTIYHYRIKSVNSVGTTNSEDITFTTLGQVPTVAIYTTTNVSISGATLNGYVNANYLSTEVTFEYGITTSYGSNITATQSPVTGSTNTNVSASITGLISGTIYHYRIKATNLLGTSYSNDNVFTTPVPIKDQDGNVYSTVVIGTQTWMIENLKTTKLNDGTSISEVTDNNSWINLTSSGYCWYNNNMATYEVPYGALYNWYAVNTGKLCPTGWHVPAYSDWTLLVTTLGGAQLAGVKMREIGTAHWVAPNTNANNESGFTLLPAGDRDGQYDGTFWNITLRTYLWSSTENSSSDASFIHVDTGNSGATLGHFNKKIGCSVRCIKN
jgi:uncharacterized protein (TIGR02145 family)